MRTRPEDLPLRVASLPDGDDLVVTLDGDLDAGSRHLLLGALDEVDHDLASGRVLLDTSNVTFVDSQGLSALLDLNGRCAELRLIAPRASFERLLSVTGTDRLLTVERPRRD